MQNRRPTIATPANDVLWKYPDMMTTSDLAEFLNVSYASAWTIMQRLPYVNVGTGKTNRSRRVHKQDVRDYFNLPDPKIRRPNFGQTNGARRG